MNHTTCNSSEESCDSKNSSQSVISLQSLKTGNDPLSIYKQASSNSSQRLQSKCSNVVQSTCEISCDKSAEWQLNRSLEDLTLFEPFQNKTKCVENKTNVLSNVINKNNSNTKPSGVSGLFSSLATTVTQNISSQIQNALRETTSNMINSNSVNSKNGMSKWSEILNVMHQSKISSPNLSNSSMEINETDAKNIVKNMNLTLFSGEKIIFFSKECGISTCSLQKPIFGSFIMTNFRIILAPLYEKSPSNKILNIIKKFSLSWMYKSGFFFIPIYSIINFSINFIFSCNDEGNNDVTNNNAIGINNSQMVNSVLNSSNNAIHKKSPFILEIVTKDIRSVQMLFIHNDQEKQVLFNHINSILNESIPNNYFCYIFKDSIKNNDYYIQFVDGIFKFNIINEFLRLGVPDINNNSSNQQISKFPLRITNINENYKLCPSYPKLIVVPKNISDKQLMKISSFRSKGRIPILCWTNPGLDCTLWRSSQPKSAFKRCMEDELLITTISNYYKDNNRDEDDKPFFILDARPKLNAYANKATGAGFENIDHYPYCKLEFLNIENIHKVRESWNKMISIIQKTSSYDYSMNNCFSKMISSFDSMSSNEIQHILSSISRISYNENIIGLKLYSDIDSTGWYDLISMILISTNKIVDQLVNGKGVLVHCSDGWDRTSQLTALSMLCIDPFYRTIEGFLTLIEKEFILAGHKFHSRCGSLGVDSCNENENERSPIFIQWLDCVYQCYTQFPSKFQFNPNLLIFITDHLNNCLFGNFLCDNDRERNNISSHRSTVSLWDAIIYSTQEKDLNGDSINSDRLYLGINPSIYYHKDFINPMYKSSNNQIKTHSDVLTIDVSSMSISPWLPFWFRFTPINSKTKSNLSYNNSN